MENPEVEIERVVQLLVRAASPDIQQAAVRKCVCSKIFTMMLAPEVSSPRNPVTLRYFTSDAGFRHPMYSVKPAHNSREGIIAIFQCVSSQSTCARVFGLDARKMVSRLVGPHRTFN
jgi:hypothetical protein